MPCASSAFVRRWILHHVDRCGAPLVGRLRELARVALDQQGVTGARLRWMGQHTSYLFRCDTATGERLVVRVYLPGVVSDAEVDAELAWLAALARDTDLIVPVARFTSHVTTLRLPSGGRCVAFGWVPGRACGRRPSRRLVADLGRVLAVLHTHALGFRAPPGFTRDALDIGRLTWAGSWHADQLARRPVDPAARMVLSRASERVAEVLDGLGREPAGYGLIHADLCLENVLDDHGQARPIDFDDASWGHYALDLAITAEDVPSSLRPALLDGYRTVRPLPPGYAEHEAALLAGRRLYLAIWHLANGFPADAYLGHLAAL